MKKIPTLICASCLLTVALPVFSQESVAPAAPGVAVSARISTLGYGAELDYPFNANWNLRVQANSFNYDDTFNESDIDYDGELDLSTVGALIDYRPFAGSFKLTAGLFSNKNNLAASATSTTGQVFDIGGARFSGTTSDPLSLSATVDLGKSTASYLGLGWGNSYSSGISFSFELGALFSGKATAELTASGTAFNIAQPQQQFNVQGTSAAAVAFRQELAAEQANLQQDLDDFEIYPVVALGVGYRF